MRQLSLLIVFVAFMTLSGQSERKVPAKDLQLLEGEWEAESIVFEGKKKDDKVVKFSKWWIKGDMAKRSVVRSVTIDGKESVLGISRYIEYKIQLDTSKKPKEIDLIVIQEKEKLGVIRGIFSLEKEKLTLCASDIDRPRPTEFVSKKNSGISLIILRKAKKGPKK
jgi:uncharacterized protein (TIGR03067 family)